MTKRLSFQQTSGKERIATWLEVARQTWKEKWESILALVGIIATLWTPLAWGWRVVWGAIALLLLIDIRESIVSELLLARRRHAPLVVFVPSPRHEGGGRMDAYGKMVDSVKDQMRSTGFDEGTFLNRFGLTRDDWVLWSESLLPTARAGWRRMVERFSLRVHRASARLGVRYVFHLFLHCPSALALGLGAALETHHPFALHHYQDGEYVTVFDSTTSERPLRPQLREVERPYRTITVEPAERIAPHVYVSVFISRHTPQCDFDRLAQKQNGAVIHIKGVCSEAGFRDLARQDDWFVVAREIADVLLPLKERGAERVHLALSCPVPLAFLIGVVLGIHSPVTIYNWFGEEMGYRAVLHLNRMF